MILLKIQRTFGAHYNIMIATKITESVFSVQ